MQVFLAELSFLCGNLALSAALAASHAAAASWASVGVHAPCNKLLLQRSSAPTLYAGHNWRVAPLARSGRRSVLEYPRACPS